jgi:hypothetical protein
MLAFGPVTVHWLACFVRPHVRNVLHLRSRRNHQRPVGWDRAVMRLNGFLSLLVLIAQPIASYAVGGGPIEGRVLDYESGKPIPGAMVVAVWEVTVPGSGQTACVQGQFAVADDQGMFRFPTWSSDRPFFLSTPGFRLEEYKAGYKSAPAPLKYFGHDGAWKVYRRDPPNTIVQTFNDRASAEAATGPNNVYMKPFVGTTSERFTYLSGLTSFTGCPNAGSSRRNFYPYLRAAYQEAKFLAETVKQARELERMQCRRPRIAGTS